MPKANFQIANFASGIGSDSFSNQQGFASDINNLLVTKSGSVKKRLGFKLLKQISKNTSLPYRRQYTRRILAGHCIMDKIVISSSNSAFSNSSGYWNNLTQFTDFLQFYYLQGITKADLSSYTSTTDSPYGNTTDYVNLGGSPTDAALMNKWRDNLFNRWGSPTTNATSGNNGWFGHSFRLKVDSSAPVNDLDIDEILLNYSNEMPNDFSKTLKYRTAVIFKFNSPSNSSVEVFENLLNLQALATRSFLLSNIQITSKTEWQHVNSNLISPDEIVFSSDKKFLAMFFKTRVVELLGHNYNSPNPIEKDFQVPYGYGDWKYTTNEKIRTWASSNNAIVFINYSQNASQKPPSVARSEVISYANNQFISGENNPSTIAFCEYNENIDHTVRLRVFDCSYIENIIEKGSFELPSYTGKDVKNIRLKIDNGVLFCYHNEGLKPVLKFDNNEWSELSYTNIPALNQNSGDYTHFVFQVLLNLADTKAATISIKIKKRGDYSFPSDSHSFSFNFSPQDDLLTELEKAVKSEIEDIYNSITGLEVQVNANYTFLDEDSKIRRVEVVVYFNKKLNTTTDITEFEFSISSTTAFPKIRYFHISWNVGDSAVPVIEEGHYPSTLAFWQERGFYSGFQKAYNKILASKTNSITDFSISSDQLVVTDRIYNTYRNIEQPILNIITGRVLFICTLGGIFIPSGNEFTQTTPLIKVSNLATSRGVFANVEGLLVFTTHDKGQIVIMLPATDVFQEYRALDLSFKEPELISDVVKMVYVNSEQTEIDNVLFALKRDNSLLAGSYFSLREDRVSWSKISLPTGDFSNIFEIENNLFSIVDVEVDGIQQSFISVLADKDYLDHSVEIIYNSRGEYDYPFIGGKTLDEIEKEWVVYTDGDGNKKIKSIDTMILMQESASAHEYQIGRATGGFTAALIGKETNDERPDAWNITNEKEYTSLNINYDSNISQPPSLIEFQSKFYNLGNIGLKKKSKEIVSGNPHSDYEYRCYYTSSTLSYSSQDGSLRQTNSIRQSIYLNGILLKNSSNIWTENNTPDQGIAYPDVLLFETFDAPSHNPNAEAVHIGTGNTNVISINGAKKFAIDKTLKRLYYINEGEKVYIQHTENIEIREIQIQRFGTTHAGKIRKIALGNFTDDDIDRYLASGDVYFSDFFKECEATICTTAVLWKEDSSPISSAVNINGFSNGRFVTNRAPTRAGMKLVVTGDDFYQEESASAIPIFHRWNDFLNNYLKKRSIRRQDLTEEDWTNLSRLFSQSFYIPENTSQVGDVDTADYSYRGINVVNRVDDSVFDRGYLDLFHSFFRINKTPLFQNMQSFTLGFAFSIPVANASAYFCIMNIRMERYDFSIFMDLDNKELVFNYKNLVRVPIDLADFTFHSVGSVPWFSTLVIDWQGKSDDGRSDDWTGKVRIWLDFKKLVGNTVDNSPPSFYTNIDLENDELSTNIQEVLFFAYRNELGNLENLFIGKVRHFFFIPDGARDNGSSGWKVENLKNELHSYSTENTDHLVDAVIPTFLGNGESIYYLGWGQKTSAGAMKPLSDNFYQNVIHTNADNEIDLGNPTNYFLQPKSYFVGNNERLLELYNQIENAHEILERLQNSGKITSTTAEADILGADGNPINVPVLLIDDKNYTATQKGNIDFTNTVIEKTGIYHNLYFPPGGGDLVLKDVNNSKRFWFHCRAKREISGTNVRGHFFATSNTGTQIELRLELFGFNFKLWVDGTEINLPALSQNFHSNVPINSWYNFDIIFAVDDPDLVMDFYIEGIHSQNYEASLPSGKSVTDWVMPNIFFSPKADNTENAPNDIIERFKNILVADFPDNFDFGANGFVQDTGVGGDDFLNRSDNNGFSNSNNNDKSWNYMTINFSTMLNQTVRHLAFAWEPIVQQKNITRIKTTWDIPDGIAKEFNIVPFTHQETSNSSLKEYVADDFVPASAGSQDGTYSNLRLRDYEDHDTTEPSIRVPMKFYKKQPIRLKETVTEEYTDDEGQTQTRQVERAIFSTNIRVGRSFDARLKTMPLQFFTRDKAISTMELAVTKTKHLLIGWEGEKKVSALPSNNEITANDTVEDIANKTEEVNGLLQMNRKIDNVKNKQKLEIASDIPTNLEISGIYGTSNI